MICDCEEPTVYDESHPVARKAHRCCECRRERIRPGDRYLRASGLWDSKWNTYIVCARCDRVRAALKRDGYGCTPFEGVAEALRERMFDRHRWSKRYLTGGRTR